MIYRRVSGILYVVLFSVILYTGCGDRSQQSVARIGGRTISANDFEKGFSRGKSDEVLGKATIEEKLEYLNKLIDKELQIVAAYRQGLDKEASVIKQVDQRGENTVLRQLIEKEVISKQIPESLIRNVYNKSKKQYQIYEIVLRKNKQLTEQQQKEFEQKLLEINDEMKAGTDFSSLVEKYTQDTKKNSKELKTLKWSPIVSEDPVYQEAFSMRKGKISDPIETRNGVSIIKVVDIIKPELRSFDEEKARIKQEFLRAKGKELEKVYLEFIDKLKTQYNANLHQENIDKIIQAAIGDTSQKSKLSIPTSIDTVLARLSSEDKSLPVFEYDGGKIDITGFFEEIERFPVMRRPDIRNEEEVLTLFNRRLIPQVLMTKEAERKNIKDDKEVKEALKGFSENIILAKIKKQEVDSKVVVTDSMMQRYFEEHRDDFVEPETREVQEIFVKDQDRANEVAAKAKTGADFNWLAKRYNEKTSTKKKNGKLGFIRESRQHIGQPAFSTGLNGVAGPIKIGANYSIIKVLSIKKQSYKTFDQSKRYVNSKATRELSKTLEKEWMANLRSEIDVSIYENRLKNIFAEFREDE